MAPNQFYMPNVAMTPPFTQPNVNQNPRYRGKGPQNYPNHGPRHDFSQQPAHVQAATGQPLVSHLPSAPMQAPQQLPVTAYHNQPANGIVTQAAPQPMYPNMYPGFHPRMNIMPHMGMMQPTIQYDPQLQHLYASMYTNT